MSEFKDFSNNFVPFCVNGSQNQRLNILIEKLYSKVPFGEFYPSASTRRCSFAFSLVSKSKEIMPYTLCTFNLRVFYKYDGGFGDWRVDRECVFPVDLLSLPNKLYQS